MTRIVSRFPKRVTKRDTVWIPMPDGVRLAATIWLPDDADDHPVPAVLEFIPYRRRDFTAAGDSLHHPWLAGHGYAAVRCDLRGNGDSEGLFDDEYSPQELDDGYHVLEWLAAQPWCSGATGMMGISWGGFNCLQVAALRPPSLKAVYSVASTDDRYADDIHFMGGCLLNDNLNWGTTMTTFAMRPPDPAVVGADWRRIWLERLENAPNLVAKWLSHQRRDGQWKHGSVIEDYDAIEAAVYMVGGWADGYTNAIFRVAAGLKAPFRGLVGPWTHAYPWKAKPGPEIDGLKDLVRWWDHWLKGIDTGMMDEPRLRCWMQETVAPQTSYDHRPGRWVAADAWPDPAVTGKVFHLARNGLTTRPGRPETLVCASEVLAGITHGDWCPYGFDAEMPSDQREEDGRSLAFDSPALGRRVEILGAPVVDLDVSCDVPQAQLYVRLCDVAPDGASTRVTYGVLNLSHRNGHEAPEPLDPGATTRIRIQLNDCGHVFPPGHRMRLAIQTGSWPLVWPSPVPAAVSVVTASSTLTLPVRPRRAADRQLPSLGRGATAPPLVVTTMKPYHRSRSMARDYVTGETRIDMVKDRGHIRIEETGTEYSGGGHETYVIRDGDPLSARARVDYAIALAREPDWKTRLDTRFVLTATKDSFLLSAHAEAHDGDERIWSRSWEDSIPRDGV